MTISDLRKLLDSLDLFPSKKLGQNFLYDQNTLQLIANHALKDSRGLIIEIGPGTGALTDYLIKDASCDYIIEYDLRLADYLTEKYKDRELTVIQADAARFDFDALVKERQWTCIANLPYAVSTIIIAKLLDLKNKPQSMTFLLQKEMADRLVANPGSKKYSGLSVKVQSLYNCKIVQKVSPNVFYPKPEVDSALLNMQSNGQVFADDLWKRLGTVLSIAFGQRRKKALKLLSSCFDADQLVSSFEKLDLSLDLRAEDISVENFRKIADDLG
ncbi:MAG: ribosomal RNA small subunit methyltransferase A [Lentisphaeria bacterium]|nr:16S rRNA (adenine(1518)-N(6)/adenine(1519)-N(6))-dimethyltransferase RsmA [Lentisphaeria bacterium]NQZ70839.1 ribosomal RNA small subunit methyltransferase A [Lentisphaeria bacterium]